MHLCTNCANYKPLDATPKPRQMKANAQASYYHSAEHVERGPLCAALGCQPLDAALPEPQRPDPGESAFTGIRLCRHGVDVRWCGLCEEDRRRVEPVAQDTTVLEDCPVCEGPAKFSGGFVYCLDCNFNLGAGSRMDVDVHKLWNRLALREE